MSKQTKQSTKSFKNKGGETGRITHCRGQPRSKENFVHFPFEKIVEKKLPRQKIITGNMGIFSIRKNIKNVYSIAKQNKLHQPDIIFQSAS